MQAVDPLALLPRGAELNGSFSTANLPTADQLLPDKPRFSFVFSVHFLGFIPVPGRLQKTTRRFHDSSGAVAVFPWGVCEVAGGPWCVRTGEVGRGAAPPAARAVPSQLRR